MMFLFFSLLRVLSTRIFKSWASPHQMVRQMQARSQTVQAKAKPARNTRRARASLMQRTRATHPRQRFVRKCSSNKLIAWENTWNELKYTGQETRNRRQETLTLPPPKKSSMLRQSLYCNLCRYWCLTTFGRAVKALTRKYSMTIGRATFSRPVHHFRTRDETGKKIGQYQDIKKKERKTEQDFSKNSFDASRGHTVLANVQKHPKHSATEGFLDTAPRGFFPCGIWCKKKWSVSLCFFEFFHVRSGIF